MQRSAESSPDHRLINSDMAIFGTDALVGTGLPYVLPAGAVIRQELELFAADIAKRNGCASVYSPVLGKRELYERSGHWSAFSDDMFPPMRVGGDEFVLRPANCPHHAVMYAAQQHSYRDLPIRFHEVGAMFRAERSGTLSGLNRVRQISLDDTHVFCRPDQIGDEVVRAVRAALDAHRVLGVDIEVIRLSRRDSGPGYLGPAADWVDWERSLHEAASRVALDYALEVVEGIGEAAFYGPKLDLQVRDARGHEETIATVQLDRNQPERFDLSYTAANGSRRRPVMIHCGTLGSMEGVTAAVLERHRGRLPLWLAPIQLCVLPVAEAQHGAARRVVERFGSAGLRARGEFHGSVGARIRMSRVRRDAVIAVLGSREEADGTVEVIDPAGRHSGNHRVDVVLDVMSRAYRGRSRSIDWP